VVSPEGEGNLVRAAHDTQVRTRQLLRRKYGIAATVTLVALVGEVALRPTLYAVPYLVFTLGVAVVTAYAGRTAGLVTLGASAVLANTIFRDGMDGYGEVLSTGFFALVGAAIVYVISVRDVAASRLRSERDQMALLADVGAEMDRSLDYQATLTAVAQMLVPRLADWCVIHLIEGGVQQRIAVAGPSPEKIEAANELWDSTPYDPDAPRGIPEVLRTGKPELLTDVDPKTIDREFPDHQQRAMLRAVGTCSHIILPIKRNGETIGVLVFAMAESGRHYDQHDLPFASLMAVRVGHAIERARWFRQTEQERARAELANQAKDQFLAMLGHELRNPLAPIRTALELMEMYAPDYLRRERTVIERQVGQLMMLVDDLLDVGRITRGTIELNRRPIELANVIANGVEIASPVVEARRHELHIDVEPGLAVDGDGARLAQVIANLVTNAAKYTEPGGRIDITGAREGNDVVVRVRDPGMGIPHELLPHVFEMFVQAPQALDRRRGGLGLGLAIVRNLVELHGGTVTASSEGPGKGSQFEVRLAAVPRQVVVAPPPQPKGEPRGRRRVLVVDDNPDALSLLADALEERGYTTARAPDGPSALAVASQLHPHVALLDIGLPVMDGYELGHLLLESDRSVKLVAVTGYGRPGDLERSQQAGFAAHLVKPISLDAVQATIDRLTA
jgi:signal transduction histidine kinase